MHSSLLLERPFSIMSSKYLGSMLAQSFKNSSLLLKLPDTRWNAESQMTKKVSTLKRSLTEILSPLSSRTVSPLIVFFFKPFYVVENLIQLEDRHLQVLHHHY